MCEWKLVEEDYSQWHTECDNDFWFSEGNPLEDGIIYCPYCGGKITVKEPEADEETEAEG